MMNYFLLNDLKSFLISLMKFQILKKIWKKYTLENLV